MGLAIVSLFLWDMIIIIFCLKMKKDELGV
jgi:hypothetical protein